MTSRTSDLDLIAAAQQGNRSAYGELVCRYRDSVVGVVYRMCGSLPTAEEAAQDAFVRAWQHLHNYQPGHPFRAWVFRIAINAALDALRREKPALDLDDGEEAGWLPADGAPGPEAALESKQRAELVRKAVLRLPAPYRAPLVLREFGGLSYAEIAAALGIPLGTVMSRLNTARSQLNRSLEGLLEVL